MCSDPDLYPVASVCLLSLHMYATTPQMHLKCTAAILCMYSIDIALAATMQSIDRLSAKYLDTLLLACLGHFMPTSVFMSQSILDFGLAPLKAKRAVVQHQKKRFEQEKDRAVLQLRSQTQLHLKRSQKKNATSATTTNCFTANPNITQTCTIHSQSCNNMYTTTLPECTRSQDCTNCPVFDVYNTHTQKKQGLTALTQNLQKSENERQCNECDTV